MRMIAGLEHDPRRDPSSAARLVNGVPPATATCAWCSRIYAHLPHMTVAENIRFPLRVARVPSGARRADRRRRRAGRARRPPRPQAAPLSGGQRQRVALGRAWSRPAAFPDGRAAVQPRRQAPRPMRVADQDLQREFEDHHVYVTHDQVEAMSLADRVAVMRRADPAGRHPRRDLRPARRTVRRRLHRHPADEPRRGRGRGRAVSRPRHRGRGAGAGRGRGDARGAAGGLPGRRGRRAQGRGLRGRAHGRCDLPHGLLAPSGSRSSCRARVPARLSTVRSASASIPRASISSTPPAGSACARRRDRGWRGACGERSVGLRRGGGTVNTAAPGGA